MQLKELRLKAGKTQKEIAEYLHMSQTGYNSYETGKSEPNIEVLKKLSKYYNKPIDYMVENDDFFIYRIDNTELSKEEERIIDAIKKMSKREQQLIIDFIGMLSIHKAIILTNSYGENGDDK